MDRVAWRAAVQRIAREEGADAVGIAPAQLGEPSRARMRASFARGDLATWGFGDRYAALATDARAVLDGARSVVCIAVAYRRPPPVQRRGRGRVAAYAWSSDYHRRVRALLDAVATRIDALAGAPVTRVVVDTAPLAERAFAERAGLGWIGKHTGLIAPGLGNTVALGEIVTTLELADDAPLRKSCGACRRCVDVCPTGALRGDHTIDATRCISDLVQRTDAIPRALRPLVGTWVWGCDLCSDACPPTQRAPWAGAAWDPLDGESAAPALEEVLRLRHGTFKRRYARTAMGWRGAAVLRRNAAVALGNELDRAHVPSLAAALSGDPHPLVRGHAAWALGRIGSPRAYAALRHARACETDPGVVDEILRALPAEPPAAAPR